MEKKLCEEKTTVRIVERASAEGVCNSIATYNIQVEMINQMAGARSENSQTYASVETQLF